MRKKESYTTWNQVCSECKDENPKNYFTLACITKISGSVNRKCGTCGRLFFDILDENPNAELFMV